MNHQAVQTSSDGWRKVNTIIPWTLMGLIAVTLLVPACDADRAEAVRAYNEGMQAFEGGATSQAVGFMEVALEEDPTFTDAAYTLGQIYQQRMGDPESAANNYRRALDHDPDNPRFAYRLGSALAEMGDHDQAISYFNQAISHDPDYARAWYDKGRSQEANGEFLDAVEAYMTAIELRPRLRLAADDPGGEHYHALADLYLRFRLHDHAVRVYENGVRNNPETVRLHHGLGVALMELGRYGEAVDSFQAALDRQPDHGSASFNIAVANYEAGNLDAAIDQLTDLVEGGAAGMTEVRRQAAQAVLDDLTAERDEEE